MRTDMINIATEEEPYGFYCRCGAVIHVKEEELTPPQTIVKCDYCGREGIFLAHGRGRKREENEELSD